MLIHVFRLEATTWSASRGRTYNFVEFQVCSFEIVTIRSTGRIALILLGGLSAGKLLEIRQAVIVSKLHREVLFVAQRCALSGATERSEGFAAGQAEQAAGVGGGHRREVFR